MSSTTNNHDYIMLSDNKGQLYAIPCVHLSQFKITDDETQSLKKFIADHVTTNTALYEMLGVFSKDALHQHVLQQEKN